MIKKSELFQTIEAQKEQIQTLLAELAEATGSRVSQEFEPQFARGTKTDGTRLDITPVPRPTPTLDDQVEALLRAEPARLEDLVGKLDLPAGRVSRVLTRLKRSGKAYNIGTEDRPLWTWRVGDEATTAVLVNVVESLLRLRPMTRTELMEATGVTNGNRISGALVQLQRQAHHLLNLGSGRRAVWYLASDGAPGPVNWRVK